MSLDIFKTNIRPKCFDETGPRYLELCIVRLVYIVLNVRDRMESKYHANVFLSIIERTSIVMPINLHVVLN